MTIGAPRVSRSRGDRQRGQYVTPEAIHLPCSQAVTWLQLLFQHIKLESERLILLSPNAVHFAIRMAALKSMRVVGCGVRGRNG